MVFVTVLVNPPSVYIPPPFEVAEFAVTVQFIAVTVAEFSMPPP
jgi:hypothetical protein